MTMARLHTGREGEEAAVHFLRGKGYRIIERNFRCPCGEMDIVARHGDVLVFVEVRSRRSHNFGLPLESIGPVKQRKLSRIALFYLQKYHLLDACKARFDVVGVRIGTTGPEIELVQDAFDLAS